MADVSFDSKKAWAAWLAENHAASKGLWLRLAKKQKGLPGLALSYAEALEVALCYGWIDGQKRRLDDSAWLQRFVPRGPRSIWSRINREKAEALLKSGAMQPAGRLAVEQARADGRWVAAYDPPSRAAVPPDLTAALARNARARTFFATLDSRNRYSILFRLQTAKKPETRARRLEEFVRMLAKGQKLHP